MAQYKVKSSEIEGYLRELIRYVIKHNRAQVIELLQSSGVSVPADVDDKTLHAIVLKAMVESNAFKNKFTDMLQNVAIEGKHSRKYMGVDGKWYNADGTPTTAGSNTQQQYSISNETLNGLISNGINLLVYKLTGGGTQNADENIKNEVNAPAPTTKKDTFKTVVITLAVVGIAGGVIWYLLKNKKK